MVLRRAGLTFATVVVAVFGAWAAAALAIDGPVRGRAAGVLAVSWLVLLSGLLVAVRPFRRALLLGVLLNAGVVAWWLAIEPSNDRAWIAEVEHLPTVRFDGDLVRIANVRDFRWRSESDFTQAWEERTYDLGKVRAADLFFSNWGPPLIEHTIMSWEFEDGRHLAISIETRKEVGEEYSAVLGFFRQFELYYVVADERDVIALRTNVRGEHVRSYRLGASPERAREVLVDYLETIDRLSRTPRWYNALTQNCTTTIVQHARHVDSSIAWDWRMLANGSADALLYLRGSIDNSLPYEELRRLSDVTAAARSAPLDENFSAAIRRGLPRMSRPEDPPQGASRGPNVEETPEFSQDGRQGDAMRTGVPRPTRVGMRTDAQRRAREIVGAPLYLTRSLSRIAPGRLVERARARYATYEVPHPTLSRPHLPSTDRNGSIRADRPSKQNVGGVPVLVRRVDPWVRSCTSAT